MDFSERMFCVVLLAGNQPDALPQSASTSDAPAIEQNVGITETRMNPTFFHYTPGAKRVKQHPKETAFIGVKEIRAEPSSGKNGIAFLCMDDLADLRFLLWLSKDVSGYSFSGETGAPAAGFAPCVFIICLLKKLTRNGQITMVTMDAAAHCAETVETML